MYRLITVFELLVVLQDKRGYESAGFFSTEGIAQEARLKLEGTKGSSLRNKIQPCFVFQNIDDEDKLYRCGEPLMAHTDVSDMKRRIALAKLTPEERELLKLE